MKSTKVITIIIVAVVIGSIGLLIIKKNVSLSPKTGRSVQNNSSSVLKEAPSRTALTVGDAFPDFSLTEVGGKAITRNSLEGKPVIVWFTTSWCVPCQIGARDVSKLDDELGGDTFNVLVVFVDLKESNNDLLGWRKNFANPDWMVAFDNELTKLADRVDLKFLDSKFMLDKNGVIKNIDFKQADENYLNTIRGVVKENI